MIKNIARWFFGSLCILVAGSLITTQFVNALAGLFLAAILIPPLEKMMAAKIGFPVPSWSKVILGIFLAGVMTANSQKPTTEEKISQPETSKIAIAETISPSPQVLAETKTKDFYNVVKVIDGDTIQIDINGKTETIRLIGVDTPESVDPRRPVQCFATEASKKAKEILTNKKVSIEADETQGERDKYKRLLRYIFLEDGSNFNKLMISEGFGHQYTYDKPYKYMEEFKAAETEAREAKRGLWGDEACLANPTPTKQTIKNTSDPKVTSTQTIAEPIKTTGTSGYTCAGKKTCGQMTSCAEAKYYLENCGLSRLDADKDGVPCESLCN